ncbi:MAG: putative ABC transporter ATP-binding protein YknY [Syntrophomonadaceae bacterium]|nr:putative ABC transporter ATP-binding protein YknY [Bacillota bacterium]
MINLKEVTKVYQNEGISVRAVDGVNLNVEAGEMVFIVGRSGSGKTTLLSLIGGLTKPTAGNILIDGVEMKSLNDKKLSALRNKKIGFIFQFASLIPTLNAIDNVRLPMIFGEECHGDYEHAKRLLEKVGLSDKMMSYPSQLSGGEQRRVVIARSLMNNPEIILADEPTGDLDEETEKKIMQLFKEINKEGTTFLIVTHLSLLYAESLYRMSKGTLTQVK